MQLLDGEKGCPVIVRLSITSRLCHSGIRSQITILDEVMRAIEGRMSLSWENVSKLVIVVVHVTMKQSMHDTVIRALSLAST